MPTASMSAKAVVGPTKAKPRRLSALARARDSSDAVGTSAAVRGPVSYTHLTLLSLIHI